MLQLEQRGSEPQSTWKSPCAEDRKAYNDVPLVQQYEVLSCDHKNNFDKRSGYKEKYILLSEEGFLKAQGTCY
jgi:hypothetical protein